MAAKLLAVAFRAGWTAGEGRIALADIGAFGTLAEAAGVDLLLAEADDGPALAPDPLTVVSALIPSTRRAGLGAEIATSAWAPFNVARAFSALDLLSGGRSAWLATSGGDAPDRYAEHLDVVFALFDSWDVDAVVLDKAAGVFTDAGRVRRIAHAGAHFTVDGPSNSPAPRQGRPLILQRAADRTAAADIVIGGAAGARRLQEIDLAGCAPEMLAGRILAAVEEEGWDGVLLRAASLADIRTFSADVAPRLALEGLIDPQATAPDLRGRLGLPRPANRFARLPEMAHEA